MGNLKQAHVTEKTSEPGSGCTCGIKDSIEAFKESKKVIETYLQDPNSTGHDMEIFGVFLEILEWDISYGERLRFCMKTLVSAE